MRYLTASFWRADCRCSGRCSCSACSRRSESPPHGRRIARPRRPPIAAAAAASRSIGRRGPGLASSVSSAPQNGSSWTCVRAVGHRRQPGTSPPRPPGSAPSTLIPRVGSPPIAVGLDRWYAAPPLPGRLGSRAQVPRGAARGLLCRRRVRRARCRPGARLRHRRAPPADRSSRPVACPSRRPATRAGQLYVRAGTRCRRSEPTMCTPGSNRATAASTKPAQRTWARTTTPSRTMLLPGPASRSVDRATQCLSDFSLDFERTSRTRQAART